MTETVAEILTAYRCGALAPEDIVARSFARLRAHDDPAIFIALREEAEVVAEARALAAKGDTTLPLYGIPVADQGQYRRQGSADHRRLPGLFL